MNRTLPLYLSWARQFFLATGIFIVILGATSVHQAKQMNSSLDQVAFNKNINIKMN